MSVKSDSKILSFVSTATANAGPDLNECENEDAIFTQASVPVGHNFHGKSSRIWNSSK